VEGKVSKRDMEHRKTPGSAHILVGVTGSIAAYKAAELVRLLRRRKHEVRVILTANGAKFITAETLQTLSGNPVRCEMFAPNRPDTLEHISLSDWAEILVVAPATANIIGKFANGIADDLLSTTFLSCDCPVVLAPAMNVRMYEKRVVQENIRKLQRLGVRFVGPQEGELASGATGKGRMSSPEEIAEAVTFILGRVGDFEGHKVLVTAGPTREMIDPVRFISNRSSGRMGLAIAESAARRGASVTLVCGPISLPLPSVSKVVNVVSAEEMNSAVLDNLTGQDALIMAAAVSDYRPTQMAQHKIKKATGPMRLTLQRTDDVICQARKKASPKTVIVGFAAETENVIENARQKLSAKGLDLIVANDVSLPDSGFEAKTNVAALIWPDGDIVQLEKMPKTELAERILDAVLQLIHSKQPGGGD